MVHKIVDLSGPNTTSIGLGVYGTDLLIPVECPDGSFLFVGGDSFDGPNLKGNARSPIGLRAHVHDINQPIRFDSAAGRDRKYAHQLLNYPYWGSDAQRTRLPTDVVTIGPRMFMHFMTIGGGGLKDCRWTGMAYSDDNGNTWLEGSIRWDGQEFGGLRQMTSMCVDDDGYVYVMTARGLARDSNIILHRVRHHELFTKSAYETWGMDRSGNWGWGNPPTPILEQGTRVMEFSFRKIDGKYVLLYATDGAGSGVHIKVADSPVGNWVTCPTSRVLRNSMNFRDPSPDVVAQLYGPYIMPRSTLKNIVFTVSQWNTQPGGNNWPYRGMQYGGVQAPTSHSPQPPATGIPNIGQILRDFMSIFRRR